MPRLYLVVPAWSDDKALAGALSHICDEADIAAVLLRLPEGDDEALTRYVASVASAFGTRDTALLLDGRADLALRIAADGAHFTGIDALTAAIGSLKPDRIAGAGGLETRHDAMLAAEAGADYVMFGDPGKDGRRPGFDAVLDRVAWWAEVFQPPCVGFAADLHEVLPLAQAGADFIALGEFVFASARPADTVKAAAAQLSSVETV